ncbi:MAG: S46 family peptidase [Bacteroidales bacterium]|nr:S46 family peptidase [Bacteroidales bacterium]
MKRFLCVVAALTVAAAGLRADEGMWLLPLLQKMNAEALTQAGCRLTPEQIYSINNSSLKDAVVQFGGGCTGEIISDEGLLVTNHHCGYSSIQKLSSVEHNYLADGYWAMNRSEELPAEGLSVTFLVSIQDVTDVLAVARREAEEQYKDSADCSRLVNRCLQDKIREIERAAEGDNPHSRCSVRSYYDDNMYYLLVYKTYNDVRFVGAPPSSIGKFGADTDNWMWPRHTCDFSMFRVYADKDNNPAPYSEDNVPYRPAQSLKVSLRGVEEGDFAMIMGYPGSTNRFQTAAQLRSMLAQNDVRINARTVRQNVLLEDMLADPAVKIQYASKYSGSTNGWKKWQGMKLAFDKLDILGRKEAEEAAFMEWVNADPERAARYGTVIDDLAKAADAALPLTLKQLLLQESLGNVEITQFAARFAQLAGGPGPGGPGMGGPGGPGVGGPDHGPKPDLTPEELSEAARNFYANSYKDYSVSTDLKVAKAMLAYYRDNADPADYCIDGLADLDIDAFVDDLFEKSAFTSLDKLCAAIEEGGAEAVENDPAVVLGSKVMKELMTAMQTVRGLRAEVSDLQRIYTEGQLAWKAGEPSYPDANFTMRLTYGNVKSYSPKDAVIYKYYTTLDGVMEKEDPDNWEFVVPAKLKELWQAKDYGQYARSDGQMPDCFLCNCDITGGNSGSPVLDADGALIGLAFDGNWESMSSDVMFEPDLQRCICVDIRYVLFIVDKFGGAGYLLDEMNILK